MIGLIYVEQEIAEHPRTRALLERFPQATHVPIERYGEVFNRKAQNFRLQKRRPALILASKHGQRVLPAPEGYGVGGSRNHYFSHMLNCVYDCRYCFLQGMYRSAHYVLFVNFESFAADIRATVAAQPEQQHWFFSGYDCDSLALDPVTGFVDGFLPVFEQLPNAWIELRTKSIQTQALLARTPIENCVVAFSFTPEGFAPLEPKVPPVARRIAAMRALADAGWPLGVRFDPLIHHPDYRARYDGLIAQVLGSLPPQALHSVSLGTFRLPRGYHRTIERLYPDAPLFSTPLADEDGMVTFPPQIRTQLTTFCTEAVCRHVPEELVYPCTS